MVVQPLPSVMLVPPLTGPSHGDTEYSSVTVARARNVAAPRLLTAETVSVDAPFCVSSSDVTSSSSAHVIHVSSAP
jgi:hypothetical protein